MLQQNIWSMQTYTVCFVLTLYFGQSYKPLIASCSTTGVAGLGAAFVAFPFLTGVFLTGVAVFPRLVARPFTGDALAGEATEIQILHLEFICISVYFM